MTLLKAIPSLFLKKILNKFSNKYGTHKAPFPNQVFFFRDVSSIITCAFLCRWLIDSFS